MKTIVTILSFLIVEGTMAADCLQQLNDLISKHEIQTSKEQIENYKTHGLDLLSEMFHERMKLHASLSTLPNECKIKMKEVFLQMRTKEDYIGALYLKSPQISSEEIDYKKIPAPFSFDFKSGDIMITKGVSFISSTISSVVKPRAIFSHIVFVHVDEKSKKVETMESYIGHGTQIFSMEDALKNENARIVILRLKDQALAKAASDFMYHKIKKNIDQGHNIPYDYELNFNDNSKLSCEEIAYDALKTISKGGVLIPENPSDVFLKDEEFLKRIGLRSGPMMVPADMETDSRFEIIKDWTDYRISRDSIRKDAVMGEFFRWINDYRYEVHDNFRSLAARVVWSTRNVPGLWQLMAKISGIPSDFKNDVPDIAITTLESIKSIGGLMLKVLTKNDEDFMKKNGRWMTLRELKETLEEYRTTHPKDLEKIFRAKKSY